MAPPNCALTGTRGRPRTNRRCSRTCRRCSGSRRQEGHERRAARTWSRRFKTTSCRMEDTKSGRRCRTCSSSCAIRSRASSISTKAKRQAEKTEAPVAVSRERRIDYPNARKPTRCVYQLRAGWDPERSSKNPGIKVGLDEFANAVYDMQEALHIQGGRHPGETTRSSPSTDQNKKKPDIFYDEGATKAVEQKKAAETERKKKTRPQGPGRSRKRPPKTRARRCRPHCRVPKVLNANSLVPDKSDARPNGHRYYIPNVWSLLSGQIIRRISRRSHRPHTSRWMSMSTRSTNSVSSTWR